MKPFSLKIVSLALFGFGVGYADTPTLKLPEAPPVPGESVSVKQLPVKPVQAKRVSLGVSVIRPGVALYAQLPQLPSGSGFLLKTVSVGDTADQAGLKAMDLIWKLGDQILINEAQMMVLLSHHRPGDKLQVSYFRSGIAKEVTLNFQPWTGKSPHPDVLAIAPPLPALPMRVISYEDRSASISDKTGIATLTYREGKFWLHIESDQGVETFNQFVTNTSEVSQVPVVWRNRLPILQRSLEESTRLRRLPRVRHVPRTRPKQRIVGGQ